VKLAGQSDGETPVVSQGVVTAYNWGKAADLPKQGGGASVTQKAGGIISAVTHAISAATGSSSAQTPGGDSDTPTGAPYIPGPSAAMFFDAMRKHREWNRDVSKIPV